jgi:hypothetical protein
VSMHCLGHYRKKRAGESTAGVSRATPVLRLFSWNAGYDSWIDLLFFEPIPAAGKMQAQQPATGEGKGHEKDETTAPKTR